jgi:hypothetical protein
MTAASKLRSSPNSREMHVDKRCADPKLCSFPEFRITVFSRSIPAQRLGSILASFKFGKLARMRSASTGREVLLRAPFADELFQSQVRAPGSIRRQPGAISAFNVCVDAFLPIKWTGAFQPMRIDRQGSMTYNSKKRTLDSQADEGNTYHSPLFVNYEHHQNPPGNSPRIATRSWASPCAASD